MSNRNKQPQRSYESADISEHSFRRKVAAGTMAIAAFGFTGAAYLNHQNQPEISINNTPVSESETATYPVIDADIETLLRQVQTANVRNEALAPSDPANIPLVSLTVTPPYDVTIQKGGGIVVDTIDAYRQMHHLNDQDFIAPTIIDSINVTARSYVERERAAGEDGQVHPDEVLSLTEIQDANGNNWAVVSDLVKFDTN